MQDLWIVINTTKTCLGLLISDSLRKIYFSHTRQLTIHDHESQQTNYRSTGCPTPWLLCEFWSSSENSPLNLYSVFNKARKKRIKNDREFLCRFNFDWQIHGVAPFQAFVF